MGSENNMVAVRYLSDRFEWAAPGDQQEDAWLVRFCDKDCGEAIFTGPEAEAEAWAYWNRYAPSYNLYVFRLARLASPQPDAQQGEVERAKAVLADNMLAKPWHGASRDDAFWRDARVTADEAIAAMIAFAATPPSPALDAATIERCETYSVVMMDALRAAMSVTRAAQDFCKELCEDSPDVPQLQLKTLHEALDKFEAADKTQEELKQ